MKHVIPAFKEFFVFGIKEARAAIFAGTFFVLLFLSIHLPLEVLGITRYDFLFVTAVLIQIILYITGLETKDEVKVICLFHVIGLVLELYKTHPSVGSWSYPEPAFFKIGWVPLYSGFMYAAIGSYIAQAWKIFKLELTNYTHYFFSVVLCALIYLNFFTNHFIQDFRFILIPAVFIFFWRTKVYFTVVENKRRSMPVILSFILIAFFIWIAENISTYYGAWQYPDQVHVWNVVSTQKITSWFLMVIISFILVAYLKHFKKDVLKRVV
jgi:uncharacterized membrane protein YoaT (DUF817 family)